MSALSVLLRRCPSAWTERNRRVRTKLPDGSVRWLPWSFTGYEFLREPHDNMAPRVTGMKGSQLGATEWIVNRELHALHALRLDTMHLLPAADEATDFSDGRFREVVENSPGLDGMFAKVDAKAHKVTVHGANAYFRGGNSRSKVKSSPVNFLGVDEYEEISAETVELARDRLEGQPLGLRWEVNVSTPIYPGTGIHKDFQLSDRRLYHMPCPECHGHTPLVWWLGEGENREPNLYRMSGGGMAVRCMVSGCDFPEAALPGARARGVWVPTNPEGAHPGYHIMGMLSPTRPWAHVLREYRRAEQDADPSVLREVLNGKVGIPHVESGMAISRALLEKHAKNQGLATGTHVAPFVAAGVDAGVRGHYLTIMGSGEAGDSRDMVQRMVRCRDYGDVRMHVLQHRVQALVVDAQPNTEKARELQRDLAGRGVACFLAYYSLSMKARLKWDMEAPDGPQVVAHRTETLNETMGRLVAGDTVLPRDVPGEALDHCAAMRKVVAPDPKGNLVALWEHDGPDHFAHSINYARLALEQAGADTAGNWNSEDGLEADEEYEAW